MNKLYITPKSVADREGVIRVCKMNQIFYTVDDGDVVISKRWEKVLRLYCDVEG